MRPEKEHIEEELFKKLDVPFRQSKDEIWDVLSKKIDDDKSEQKPTRIISLSWVRYAAAAVICLLVGLTAFFRFHVDTFECKRGEQLSHVLPDGSEVKLNAASVISYHPYWWRFKRELNFEGEAFFDVKKGSTFKVISKIGVTEVLGTSFNISTRNNGYSVLCSTGRVKVTGNINGNEVIIEPDMMAMLNSEGLQVEKEVDEALLLGWMLGKFNFNAQALLYVFEELERQYDIVIITDRKKAIKLSYTGFFKRTNEPELSLDLIHPVFYMNLLSLSMMTRLSQMP